MPITSTSQAVLEAAAPARAQPRARVLPERWAKKSMSQDLQPHRHMGWVPGRFDRIDGVHGVVILPGDEGGERPGHGAFGHIGPRSGGDGEQKKAEGRNENAGDGHRRPRRICRHFHDHDPH